MAKKKKTTKKSTDATPPAARRKSADGKSKPAATKKAGAAKKVTTEKKSTAGAKAATTIKPSVKMAKKEIPASSGDKKLKATAKTETLNPQIVSEDKKIELARRTATTDQLNKLISDKVAPMLSDIVKRKSTTTKTTTESATTKSVVPKDVTFSSSAETFTKESIVPKEVAFDASAEVFTDAVAAPAATNENPVEVTNVTVEPAKDDGGFKLGSFTIDWKKFDMDVLKEMSKIFRERTEEETKPAAEEVRQPMVIVADFTLPYQCCEDYVCEDMCYSDEELAMLPIPPFAKDDFAVTRKDTAVDIYPDLNDSHLFKDYIVVREIEKEEAFTTAAGGKVTTDKSGEHPHFIYTPPAGESGISDSFNYTLINLKNDLSDTATVWIEVAEALPSFSMNTQVCHNAGLQTITVDPNGNDMKDIEVDGPGIEKIIDTGTGETIGWSFNPKFPGVVIGVNTFRLTLNGKEVQTIDVTVTEILADFSDQGEVQSIDPESGIGMVVIHDQSLNVQDYEWEWKQGSGQTQTANVAPDNGGVVLLPLPNTPRNVDFILSVSLKARSPEGCVDTKKMDVGIAALRSTPTFINVISKVCSNATPIVLTVDAKGNDLNTIDITGNGVIKTFDAANLPVWTFDPGDPKVVIGVNTLKLTLKKKQVETKDITVTEIKAEFDTQGQFVDLGPKSEVYRYNVAINDKSVNVNHYHFEYGLTQAMMNIGLYGLPDQSGKVLLPIEYLKFNPEGFSLFTRLNATSPEGCTDVFFDEVKVAPFTMPAGITVMTKHLDNVLVLVDDPAVKKLNIPSNQLLVIKDSAKNLLNLFIYGVATDDLASLTNAIAGSFPPRDFMNNEKYMAFLNSASIATIASLVISTGDPSSAARNTILAAMEAMAEAGYKPDLQSRNDLLLLEQQVGGRTNLEKAFLTIHSLYQF